MARVRLIDDATKSDARVTAIYVRVTREESLKLDLSIPNQKNRAVELCGERGWGIAKIYQEPRQVGGDLLPRKRPALAALLADVEAGRVERVLVRHTDRLWRSTEVEEIILRALHQHSVELWDFHGPRELRSAGGRFALKVLGAAAELEKGLTAERIREMKRGKALAGKTGGGPPPFGYTSQTRARREALALGVSEDDAHRLACERYPIAKTWYVDEGEADVVRLIFDLYLGERMGCRRISQELNKRGYKRRGGYPWAPVKVGKVINNPAVAGLCSFDEDAYGKGLPSRQPRFRQKLYPGSHPALIPAEKWHEGQRVKRDINIPRTRTKSGAAARVYPLLGILRCGRCGSHMMGKSSGGEHPAYYICARRKYYGTTDGCAGPTVHQAWAEKTVWTYLLRVLESPAFVKELLDRTNARLRDDAPGLANRSAQIGSEIAALRQKQSKWMERFENAADDAAAEVIWQRVRELKAKEIALSQEGSELEAKLAGPTKRELTERDITAYLSRLRQGAGSSANKRRVFAELLERHHDLRVRVEDTRKLIVSLRLDRAELSLASGLADPIGERLVILPKSAKASTRTAPATDARPVSPGSPLPGGPTNKRLWPPAAASSSARRALACPRTSAKSPLLASCGTSWVRGASGSSRSPRR
jgi:DNA invertase Pin-like site-specific DNA recombinase